jgi:hypothetical protein
MGAMRKARSQAALFAGYTRSRHTGTRRLKADDPVSSAFIIGRLRAILQTLRGRISTKHLGRAMNSTRTTSIAVVALGILLALASAAPGAVDHMPIQEPGRMEEIHVSTLSWLKVIISLETMGILLFLGMLFGSLIAPRGKELLFHGFIAGLVGAGLAIFDLGMRYLIGRDTEQASLWLIAAIVFGIFFAIFVAVVSLEALQEGRPVPLKGIGIIDGDYIDAVYAEDGHRSGASMINITSTRRNGFVLRGTAYDHEDLSERGKFDGAGSVSSSDGICYYYRGHEWLTTDDGVCYYRFSHHAGNITFFGGFMAFGLKASHRVQGRKLLKQEEALFKTDPKAVLRDFLEREAPKQHQKPAPDDRGTRTA